jgi:hypothetical protein
MDLRFEGTRRFIYILMMIDAFNVYELKELKDRTVST